MKLPGGVFSHVVKFHILNIAGWRAFNTNDLCFLLK